MLRNLLKYLKRLLRNYSKEEKGLALAIKRIVGSKPYNLHVFTLALSHSSASKTIPRTSLKASYERLEYLGDAILGAVVAEYLFKKYPFKEEGFLTEIRSRIVNRESLNELAKKIGLLDLIRYEGKNKKKMSYKSIGGDALEALVGAVYLDKGFHLCRDFIIKRLIQPHYDLEQVISQNKNFKSLLIEWAQRENKAVKFKIIDEKGSKHQRQFIAQILINEKGIATGSGYSKKKAEQAAAEKTCKILDIQ